MSSVQVRNLKIFCSTCIAPRKLPALANGPYSFDAAGARLARELDAGKILARGDLQVRKRLVVLQILVVLRLDVLDQPGFHQQGVDFALGVEVVDVAISRTRSAVRRSSAAALRK